MLRIVGATLASLLLTACAPSTLSSGPSSGHLRADDVAKSPGTIPQPVQQITSINTNYIPLFGEELVPGIYV